MIVDAHGHIYDILTGYGAKGEFRPLGKGKGIWATGEVEQFFPEEYGDLGFRAEALLVIMDQNGVDHTVLMQSGNYGLHNEYVAEAARQWPKRFTATASVDPYALHARSILEHLLGDYGIRVLKFELSRTWGLMSFHPQLRMGTEIFQPILQRADNSGLTVVIDMGPMGTDSFEPEALLWARQQYPNITFVMTHCFFPTQDGNNPLRLDYMKRLVSDRFYFDISNLVAMEKDVSAIHTFLRGAKAAVGADHMLWGTDVPGVLNRYSYKALMELVTKSGAFTEKELPLVMGANAQRVYGIPG